MEAQTTPPLTRTSDGPPAPETMAASPLVRALLIVVGTIALVLGVVGIFLPVLPTTPFLLVTAACYARASTRLYEWLVGQPSLGPIVTEWRRSRSLPPGVKTRALIAVAVTFAVSIIIIDSLLLRIGLVIAGVVLATFLSRIPTAQDTSVTMVTTSPQKEAR